MWDPLGIMGDPTGGDIVGGGIVGGPLGFLGGLLGGLFGDSGAGSGGGSSSGGGSPYVPESPNIVSQLMPLFMLVLVAYLAIKFLPKLIK